MKKLFMLSFVFAICVTPAFSQKSKPAPRPAPAPAPKGPPPYVLKKDYEPQMEELKSKVNAAANAAAAVRNSVDAKFSKVVLLDSQMTQVQEILNSASFQIAMNADSLKETRFSMEEFQKKTEANFSTMQEHEEAFSQKVWMLFATAMVLTVIVLITLLVLLQKRMAAIQNTLHKNEEVIKKSLSIQLEKQHKELKDELQSSESRTLLDIATIKREISHQLNAVKEANAATIQTLTDKVVALENSNVDGDSEEPTNVDPEVFI